MEYIAITGVKLYDLGVFLYFFFADIARCSAPKSHGASLTSHEEDAFLRDVSMAPPARRRESE